MRFGTAEARVGARSRGVVEVGRTASGLPIQIPLTVVAGRRDGPTLLVAAAVHGEEVVGSLAIGRVLRELDPADLRGILVAAPVVNTSAFEFAQRHTYWDQRDLNRVGAGRPDGSVTERLAHRYIIEVIRRVDFMVDIHCGPPHSYMYYTIFNADLEGVGADVVAKSRAMALAYGLEQVFARTPWRGTLKEVALRAGVPSITPEHGGGADFYRGGRDQVAGCVRGITNVMRHLEMLPGRPQSETGRAVLWDAHTEIVAGSTGGMYLREAWPGDRLEAGDVFGVLYDPYTGEELERITTPRAGTVLNTGVVWPVVRPTQWLGLVGDRLEEVDLGF
ncbi:MAG: succinylglutamate desuccinylase/aspartoacylase family protein [Armatimonadota bacterium]|nr:succinylglutamate desuccinylase/aspartoacylase family protein [Armatimonadota bacterium]MDR7488517.1 succinylglutamate desuccinylase/aspartoacylase family protein [Armatimonadota bacterium]MDR7573792.1 succinylglutamate desuccinylase/aspartoacylase family protein [Armatimonadota bacterium]MDR7586539.1 succinylglutamate desuccinylase/aspartoacylase family protein [Armatimonadota bacterium]